jgi:hypothetical protein
MEETYPMYAAVSYSAKVRALGRFELAFFKMGIHRKIEIGEVLTVQCQVHGAIRRPNAHCAAIRAKSSAPILWLLNKPIVALESRTGNVVTDSPTVKT